MDTTEKMLNIEPKNHIWTGIGLVSAIIAIILLIGFILYIFVDYQYFKQSIQKQVHQVKQENVINTNISSPPILQSINITPETKSTQSQPTILTRLTLIELLKKAIDAIKANFTTINTPIFYNNLNNDITIVVKNYSFYLPVFKLAQFIVKTPGIDRILIDNSLIDIYGSLQSPDLFVNQNGQEYYIVLQFDPALTLYLNNQAFLDSIL